MLEGPLDDIRLQSRKPYDKIWKGIPAEATQVVFFLSAYCQSKVSFYKCIFNSNLSVYILFMKKTKILGCAGYVQVSEEVLALIRYASSQQYRQQFWQ